MLTPLDIYQQEFKTVIRGLDPDAVEDFLGRIADDYEHVIKENEELKKQIESMKSRPDAGSQTKAAAISEEEIRETAEELTREAKKTC